MTAVCAICVCCGVCGCVCGVVYVLSVCVWDVRLVFWCCGVLCCVLMCGVGSGASVQCVAGGVYGVCAWCVVAAAVVVCCVVWKKPCVGSKRLRVYQQNARMCSTCARFASTHGDVLNLHTGRREGVWGEGSLLSLSLFPFLFLSSFVLFLFPLLSSLSSLSVTTTMFALCAHSSDLPKGQSAWTLAHSLLAEDVRIMHETIVLALNCASLVPLGMKWACIRAGNW